MKEYTAPRRIKGTMALEYSVMIAIIVAALLGMQVYFKRAICSRWKESGDVFGFGRQYENGTTTITKF